MKILIPTCLPHSQLDAMLVELSQSVNRKCTIVTSCLPASASVNRNICLDRVSVGETAIMLDDDIRGFYHGWVDDLIAGFADPRVVMVSARLLDGNGAFGRTCSGCMAPFPDEIEVAGRFPSILPTAAIAFLHRGHRFDEKFRGSGWEDSDWCQQYVAADPSALFIQSNRCRLVHMNEMKNQSGAYWQHNYRYFYSKWRQPRSTNASHPAGLTSEA